MTQKLFSLSRMYPLYSFFVAVVVAQVLKPFFGMLKGKGFRPLEMLSAGGFPSSHSAGVSSLCLATGLVEKFDSTLFAVTLAFSIIVIYDATHVRYYAGKNIELTKAIVNDLKEETNLTLDNPIYNEKLKEVLGHRWSEATAGIILGCVVAVILFSFVTRG